MLGGGALTIAGVLTTVVAPLLADALGAAGLDNTGIGAHLTALHLAQVVVIFGLAGSGLVARLDRRLAGLTGCLVSASALCAAAVTSSSQLLALEMLVVGLGAGLAYAGGASALSFARDTERAYSIVTIASIAIGSVVLAGTALVPVEHNQVGIFVGIAVVLVLLGLAGLRLPQLATERPEPRLAVTADRLVEGAWLGAPGAALIVGYFLLNVGILAVWTFAGSIGQAAGMTSAQSWWFLGAAQVLSVIGCLIAWYMGARPGKQWVLVASLGALVVGKAMIGSAVLVPYVAGILITNLTFYTVIPFVFAAGADLNPRSGRLVVIVGASAMAAGAVAPLAGGIVAGPDNDWARLGYGAGLVILLSAPLLLYAVRTAYSRKYGSGHEPSTIGDPGVGPA